MTETLGEAFPKQQARVREVLDAYKQCGPMGTFAVINIEQALQRADKAAIDGDLVEMIRSFKELQRIKS